MPGKGVFEIQFNAGQLHWWKELAVGELAQTFRLTADASEFFDVVIPGGYVGIANRPIDGDSIFQVGFKIEITPAIALPSPSDGLTAHLAPANPGKMLAGIEGVGIILIVDKKLVRVFVACVIALALDGLGAFAHETIIPVAMLEFPDGNVLDVVVLGDNGAPRLQDECVESFFGEFFRGPAAGDSRTNNDCVVGRSGHGLSLCVSKPGAERHATVLSTGDDLQLQFLRSEERRVGKECRSGWGA